VVLAIVFLTAGVGKLLDLEGSRRAMRDFGLPASLARIGGIALPLAELTAAAALVLRASGQWGGLAALVLLLGFIGGIANALRHGVAPDCHCFGQLHSAPAGRGTLARNCLLAAVAAFVVIEGPGPAVDTWFSARSSAELVAIGLGACAALAVTYATQLRFQLHRMNEELGVARRLAAGAPPGLPIGTPAPGFALQSVNDEESIVTLEQLQARGHPVLLVFASAGCHSCVELFPSIRRWQQTLQERLTIAVISSGSVKANRALVDEHGLADVVTVSGSEMIEAYRVRGTPTAVLVERDGRIATVPAESVFGIEPMVRLVLRDGAAEAGDPTLAHA